MAGLNTLGRAFLCFCFLITLPMFTQPVFAQDSQLTNLLQDLASDLTSKKRPVQLRAIDTIAKSDNQYRERWLTFLLQGELYVNKSDKSIVHAVKSGKGFAISNPDNGEALGEVKKRALSKVRINNAIRVKLKGILGTMRLTDPDPLNRLVALEDLTGKADSVVVDTIRGFIPDETDNRVKGAMQLLIGVHDLKQGSDEQQRAALEYAEGKLDIELINELRTLSINSEDENIRSRALTLVEIAENKKRWYARVETLFFGLSLGSVLVVAAIGLAITFGVMGVINMAHGELIMLGAYTTYFVQQLLPSAINYSLLIAIPAAFLVSGVVGIIIERGVIRHLYGRPLETLLATFGISLMLQQTVRTFVSSQNVAVINPVWMSGSLEINPALSLTLNRLIILAFCLVVFMVLLLVLNRSSFGLQMRAVAQNRQMARAMGIRSSRVDALTFGLGSGIAGIAGVALSQLGNVGPNLGQNYIIDSFMVVVFGGVGNLWGTLVAGMSLGIANKVVEPWAGAVMAKILILVFIIMFIQRKPKGLFPQLGRAAGD